MTLNPKPSEGKMTGRINRDKVKVYFEYRRGESASGDYYLHQIILWACREFAYNGKIEPIWDRLLDVKYQSNVKTSDQWYAPEVVLSGCRSSSPDNPQYMRLAIKAMNSLARYCDTAPRSLDRRGIVEWLHRNKIGRVYRQGHGYKDLGTQRPAA